MCGPTICWRQNGWTSYMLKAKRRTSFMLKAIICIISRSTMRSWAINCMHCIYIVEYGILGEHTMPIAYPVVINVFQVFRENGKVRLYTHKFKIMFPHNVIILWYIGINKNENFWLKFGTLQIIEFIWFKQVKIEWPSHSKNA